MTILDYHLVSFIRHGRLETNGLNDNRPEHV